jgi:hypothetical protein
MHQEKGEGEDAGGPRFTLQAEDSSDETDVLRSHRGNNGDEIGYGDDTAPDELTPFSCVRAIPQKSNQARRYQQEMPGSRDHRERQVGTFDPTGLQEDEQLVNASPDERRHEQVDVVPKR